MFGFSKGERSATATLLAMSAACSVAERSQKFRDELHDVASCCIADSWHIRLDTLPGMPRSGPSWRPQEPFRGFTCEKSNLFSSHWFGVQRCLGPAGLEGRGILETFALQVLAFAAPAGSWDPGKLVRKVARP